MPETHIDMITDELILKGEKCPYCLRKTEFVDSSIIYGESYGMIYLCHICKAWVGVHKDTNISLGRLANTKLRKAKINAHKWFDKIARTGLINKIWRKYIPHVSNREKAYIWLSEQINIPVEYCHIGMFDIEECNRVIQICKKALN